jgi:hypothetical protein
MRKDRKNKALSIRPPCVGPVLEFERQRQFLLAEQQSDKSLHVSRTMAMWPSSISYTILELNSSFLRHPTEQDSIPRVLYPLVVPRARYL